MKIFDQITIDEPMESLFPQSSNDEILSILQEKERKIMNNMTIDSDGVELIKKFEGFRSKAYLDSVGIPTIGYGTIAYDGGKVKLGDTCTKAQAEQWLIEYIKKDIEPHLSRLVKVPLTQAMVNTLGSFIYNLGARNFEKSTLLKKLNMKDYAGAADQLLRWDYGKVKGKSVQLAGLTKRREAEREIFIASINDINSNIG